MKDDLLIKVKRNLVLEHESDDEMLSRLILSAIAYAQSYQHTKDIDLSPATEQAVIILASHLYESRDGSSAGFFGDNIAAAKQVWNAVNTLLTVDKNWQL